MFKYAIKPLDSQIKHEPLLIPRPPSQILLVSPIGSGKSTVLINMLISPAFYRGYFDRILIFAPTFNRDVKWLNVLNVKNLLRKSEEQAESSICLYGSRVSNPRPTGKISPSDIYLEYDNEALADAINDVNRSIEAGEDKRLAVVFEDVLGLGLFDGKHRKQVTELASTLRHSGCTTFYCVQSYKTIPRVIRVNCLNLIIFGIKNQQERRKVHEEFPMIGDFNKWNALFDVLTQDDHSFVHMNFQNAPRYQLIQNFDRFVDTS